jgi:hypothetical protein
VKDMKLSRSMYNAVFVLLCALLLSACGTVRVGLESMATATRETPSPAPATATPTPSPKTPTPVPVTPTHTPAPRSPTATATQPPTATPTPAPSPTVDVAPGWETYTSERFQVTFRYPPDWHLDTVHGGEAYTGPDGYFILDAIGSGGVPIDEVAANQAHHHLLPFGSDPTIESLEIEGQKARLILPSADATMGDQSLLIVRYPQPVMIQGTAYDYFALYADEAHIRTIAETLRFASQRE